MLTLEEAQAVLASVGTDTPPTAESLRAARAAVVLAAKEAKTKGDKLALTTMLEAIRMADTAITAAEELESQSAQELSALVADIPELADEAPAEPEAQPEPEAPRILSLSEAAARLGLSPAAEERIEVTEREPRQTLTVAGQEASDASWSDLGDAFARETKTAYRAGKTNIATFRTEYDNRLTGKKDADSRVLDELSRAAGDQAVIAAGGCCTLAEPIRDQPMLESLARPLADALPTVGAPAGAVSFFPPICLPVDGVDTWTCADDAAVDPADPDTWKTCHEVECDDVQTETLDSIYRCLTIGNFNQRFNGERWDAYLHKTAAMWARVAEISLFNKIATDPNVTTHTVTDTGSIYVTFLQTVLRAAATIRQNQRYGNIGIRVFAASWLNDAILADRISRAAQRGRSTESSDVATILAENNITVTWSPDLNPIEPNGQVSGPLTAFPATASIVLFVDGGVFRLDGGELNLGTEIRDMQNNRQNQVSAFSESWETAVVRTCDAKAITLPVTVCGQAPCQPAPAPGSSEDAPLFTQEVTAP